MSLIGTFGINPGGSSTGSIGGQTVSSGGITYQSTSATTSGLTLSTDDPVYHLITNTPSFISNPVGKKARKALVSKLKHNLPGHHSSFRRNYKTFRKLFCPHYSRASYETDVVSITGLSENFWKDFSVAVFCQSIYHQTDKTHKKLT